MTFGPYIIRRAYTMEHERRCVLSDLVDVSYKRQFGVLGVVTNKS